MDPAELSELALGVDPPGAGAAEHLRDCAHCRSELAALRRVVRSARTALGPDPQIPPPPRVWQGIAAALSQPVEDATAHDADAHDADAHVADPHAADAHVADPHAADASVHDADAHATDQPAPAVDGTSGGPHRRRTWRRMRRSAVLLAAACLVVGAAVGSAGTYLLGGDAPAPAVSAGPDATLSPLPGDGDGTGDRPDGTGGPGGTAGGPAAGTVRLERLSEPSSARSAGPAREVRIQVSGLPRTSGFFEVWLMDAAGKKLISLGVLRDDGTATLPLPPGVDIGEYSQVDVSDQAFNGSPAHSGRSVVRGSLTG